jgi:hypothetical protein
LEVAPLKMQVNIAFEIIKYLLLFLIVLCSRYIYLDIWYSGIVLQVKSIIERESERDRERGGEEWRETEGENRIEEPGGQRGERYKRRCRER